MIDIQYGGDATLEKLDVIERYGDAYTTALVHQPFILHYVDGFAGRGIVRVKEGAGLEQDVPGSAVRALDIKDRPFDRLLFIEKDYNNALALRHIIRARGDEKRATVKEGDANDHLVQFARWLGAIGQYKHRALIFIDPFATEVDWTTIEELARSKRCDVLMLIPLMAVRRLVKRHGFPIQSHQDALTRIFGDESWRRFYQSTNNHSFSSPGFRAIIELYVERLETVFVRVVEPQRTLGASSERSMFTLLFAAANERGAKVAADIANGVFKAAHGSQGRMSL